MDSRAVTVYVGLGSNLGDREAHLLAALAALRASPGLEVLAVSPLYETDPVGPTPQGPYLNAVAELRTASGPRRLLERLLAIEARAGRTRAGARDAPRTLDLDLLLFGDAVVDEPGLCVPHPRLHERGFALEPLADLAPRRVHPRCGERIEALARRRRDPQAVRRRPGAPAGWGPLQERRKIHDSITEECADTGPPELRYHAAMAAEASPRESRKSIKDDVLRFIQSGAAETLSAEEILGWAIGNFGDRLSLSCSFGAPEGLALLDMMHRIDPASRVFVLDTGRLPQETYDLIDRVRERYDKRIEVVFPRAQDVEAMVRERGLNLFYESVEQRQWCCRVRKVEPMKRHLAGLDAWVTGLRRDQNVTREQTPKLEIDRVHGGIVKVNPIADWTRDQVLGYVREHEVPINRLHAQGYPSVGCAPCSRAVASGDDPRSGRWWWENPETRECGIHVGEEDQGSGI